MPTIDQGKALHRMGRIAEAEAIYRSVLARDPREFDALHLLGLIRYQQGRAGEAHELLSRAIELRPRSPQALAILMAALLALGRLEEALAACDRLIALNPRDSYKLTPRFFDVWMRLLGQVEGSVLWLLGTSEAATRNLRHEASARGVDPSRLVFAPKAKMSKHLARHRLADVFLDNLPVNAHTAASDALWVGLPVLTCMGESFVGRVAASLLSAAGAPELVTRSLDEYEALALKLATDSALIASIRQKLDRNRNTCPLFDTDRLRRDIERAYVTMWDIARRGEPPRSFAVDAI